MSLLRYTFLRLHPRIQALAWLIAAIFAVGAVLSLCVLILPVTLLAELSWVFLLRWRVAQLQRKKLVALSAMRVSGHQHAWAVLTHPSLACLDAMHAGRAHKKLGASSVSHCRRAGRLPRNPFYH